MEVYDSLVVQLVRESKGAEATPSGWQPGKKTLKQGIDLVGKVWQDWKTSMAFDRFAGAVILDFLTI